MASISVQAGVGAHVLDERPEDARAALLAIKHASGDALAELRATLSMLRSSEAAPREPAAGLDRLPLLVEGSRAAGLVVDVVIEGDVRPLPPADDTAASPYPASRPDVWRARPREPIRCALPVPVDQFTGPLGLLYILGDRIRSCTA